MSSEPAVVVHWLRSLKRWQIPKKGSERFVDRRRRLFFFSAHSRDLWQTDVVSPPPTHKHPPSVLSLPLSLSSHNASAAFTSAHPSLHHSTVPLLQPAPTADLLPSPPHLSSAKKRQKEDPLLSVSFTPPCARVCVVLCSVAVFHSLLCCFFFFHYYHF
jgi:hypothetical protein